MVLQAAAIEPVAIWFSPQRPWKVTSFSGLSMLTHHFHIPQEQDTSVINQYLEYSKLDDGKVNATLFVKI